VITPLFGFLILHGKLNGRHALAARHSPFVTPIKPIKKLSW
jgi:hypothetical protein